MKEGKRKRFQYYKERLNDFLPSKRNMIFDFLKSQTRKRRFLDDTIIHFFNKKHDKEDAINLFEKALNKGIFHETEDNEFIVPVPSMRTWLLDQFGNSCCSVKN